MVVSIGCRSAEPAADRPAEPTSPTTPAQDPSPLGQSYENAEAGFSIQYPKGWTSQEVTDQSGVVVALFARRSAGDGFAENVNILREELPPNVTFEQYTQANLANLAQTFPNADVLEEEERGIGEHPGHWIRYDAEQRGQQVSFLQAWLIEGQRAYILSYTGQGADFDVYRPDAEAIFQSFRLS